MAWYCNSGIAKIQLRQRLSTKSLPNSLYFVSRRLFLKETASINSLFLFDSVDYDTKSWIELQSFLSRYLRIWNVCFCIEGTVAKCTVIIKGEIIRLCLKNTFLFYFFTIRKKRNAVNPSVYLSTKFICQLLTVIYRATSVLTLSLYDDKSIIKITSLQHSK